MSAELFPGINLMMTGKSTHLLKALADALPLRDLASSLRKEKAYRHYYEHKERSPAGEPLNFSVHEKTSFGIQPKEVLIFHGSSRKTTL